MKNRRSRPLLAGVSVAALALCIGSVSARPEASPGKAYVPKVNKTAGLDPVFVKASKPTAVSSDMKLELQKKVTPEYAVPAFNLKRLDGAQKAILLGAPSPAAVPGPWRFDARTHYHDDNTYMETLAYSGGAVGVRPLRNYFHFMGTAEVMASPYLRPGVLIHYTAEANTRYLIECAVDASGATTFTASDGDAQYSVQSIDKATLLYLRSARPTQTQVVVQITGDTPGWYLDGCELTQFSQ